MARILGWMLLWAGLHAPCFASPADDEAGALAFMNGYIASFKQLDVHSTATHFHEPLTVVAGSGVTVFATQAEVAAWYRPLFARLAEKGYGRSEWRQLQLRALGNGVVIASASAVRYQVDGSEIETVGATYLLRNTAQGWRIAVLTSHPASAALLLQ